ncbi:MAG: DUF805 domain-containing protein [Caulobacteraceae bacterium]|nr:DUF805 domain-containing protein [Caulobacter sp.]RYF92775.1 MAG: DUF805 domain-containing protein [Caulobacteraceae bacterium]
MDQMIAPLRKYADFHGRATRTEFWMFFLFRVLLVVAFVVPFVIIVGISDRDSNGGPIGILASLWLGLACLVYLALIIPELAVTVRRLHDQDLSGWFVLLGLVPMGGFVVFIFMLLKGTNGTNRHGPDPRAPTEQTASIFA